MKVIFKIREFKSEPSSNIDLITYNKALRKYIKDKKYKNMDILDDPAAFLDDVEDTSKSILGKMVYMDSDTVTVKLDPKNSLSKGIYNNYKSKKKDPEFEFVAFPVPELYKARNGKMSCRIQGVALNVRLKDAN